MEGNNKERQLKLSEAHSYLGDISCKNEQFEEASKDYQSCLKIREQVRTNNEAMQQKFFHMLASTHLVCQHEPLHHILTCSWYVSPRQLCCKDDRRMLEIYHSLATSLSLQDSPDRVSIASFSFTSASTHVDVVCADP